MTTLAAAQPIEGLDLNKDRQAAPASTVFARRHDGSFFELDGSITDNVFDQLLLWCQQAKASDVTIQTDQKVLAEIGADIVPITRRPITHSEIDRIIRYIYGEHGPGMLKAAHDLDPSHEVRMGRGIGLKRYRVNMTAGRVPGGDGVQITIRTLPSSPIPLSELGIEDDIIRNIRPQQGMVLVTGPTGSGKSTLLSSCIRHIMEKPDANEKILEYSSPIEYVYDDVKTTSASIWQTEVGRHLLPYEEASENSKVKSQESLYAYAVRNALRRKPTIIMVGETRDRATMMASMEAALTGHLLFSTLHVVGVPASLRRVIQFFPGDQRESTSVDIMESLRMVVTQLLFPRVGGGRVALREYMVFDDQTRAQFMRKPTEEWPTFARRLMAEKRVTSKRMTDSAWDAYEAGLITGDIYKKIVNAERDSA